MQIHLCGWNNIKDQEVNLNEYLNVTWIITIHIMSRNATRHAELSLFLLYLIKLTHCFWNRNSLCNLPQTAWLDLYHVSECHLPFLMQANILGLTDTHFRYDILLFLQGIVVCYLGFINIATLLIDIKFSSFLHCKSYCLIRCPFPNSYLKKYIRITLFVNKNLYL